MDTNQLHFEYTNFSYQPNFDSLQTNSYSQLANNVHDHNSVNQMNKNVFNGMYQDLILDPFKNDEIHNEENKYISNKNNDYPFMPTLQSISNTHTKSDMRQMYNGMHFKPRVKNHNNKTDSETESTVERHDSESSSSSVYKAPRSSLEHKLEYSDTHTHNPIDNNTSKYTPQHKPNHLELTKTDSIENRTLNYIEDHTINDLDDHTFTPIDNHSSNLLASHASDSLHTPKKVKSTAYNKLCKTSTEIDTPMTRSLRFLGLQLSTHNTKLRICGWISMYDNQFYRTYLRRSDLKLMKITRKKFTHMKFKNTKYRKNVSTFDFSQKQIKKYLKGATNSVKCNFTSASVHTPPDNIKNKLLNSTYSTNEDYNSSRDQHSPTPCNNTLKNQINSQNRKGQDSSVFKTEKHLQEDFFRNHENVPKSSFKSDCNSSKSIVKTENKQKKSKSIGKFSHIDIHFDNSRPSKKFTTKEIDNTNSTRKQKQPYKINNQLHNPNNSIKLYSTQPLQIPPGKTPPPRMYKVVMNKRKYWRVESISPETGRRVYKHFGENRHGQENAKLYAKQFYNKLNNQIGPFEGMHYNKDYNYGYSDLYNNDSKKVFDETTHSTPQTPQIFCKYSHHDNTLPQTLQLPEQSYNYQKSNLEYNNLQNIVLNIPQSNEVEYINFLWNNHTNQHSLSHPSDISMCSSPSRSTDYCQESEKHHQHSISLNSTESNMSLNTNIGFNKKHPSQHRLTKDNKIRKETTHTHRLKGVRSEERVPGRIYMLKIRDVNCWRSEWYDRSTGKRMTRQFAETVHGTTGARLKALEVLVNNKCVPQKLLKEAANRFGYDICVEESENKDKYHCFSDPELQMDNLRSHIEQYKLMNNLNEGNTNQIRHLSHSNLGDAHTIQDKLPPYLNKNGDLIKVYWAEKDSTRVFYQCFSESQFGSAGAIREAWIFANNLCEAGYILLYHTKQQDSPYHPNCTMLCPTNIYN